MTVNVQSFCLQRHARLRSTLAVWLSLCLSVHNVANAQENSANGWVLSGSHRIRFEQLDNQFRPGLNGSDQALQLRTLLQATRRQGAWEGVLELQDARSYLDDAGSWHSTINVDALDLLQAHVVWRQEDVLRPGATLALRLGRQTMDYGGRRLIARNSHRNTLQTYTGWRGTWTSARTTVDLFHFLPVLVSPDDAQGLLDNKVQRDREGGNLQFWGVLGKFEDVLAGIDLETYLLGLHEQDSTRLATADRELLTPGFRLVRSPRVNTWDLDLEVIGQRGTRRASRATADTGTLTVKASFVHATLGYTFAWHWSPRVALQLDRGTGDRDPADDRFERFDSLFGPRRAELNATGIYGLLGRENLNSFGVRLGLQPDARRDLFISLRHNRLVSASDVFARSGVQDASGASGRHAGEQLEFRYRQWLLPEKLRWELGGVWFAKGRFLSDAPNANDEGNPRFFYTDLSWQF